MRKTKTYMQCMLRLFTRRSRRRLITPLSAREGTHFPPPPYLAHYSCPGFFLRRGYREARLAICCKAAAAKHRAEGESGEGERVPPVAAAIYLSGHGSLHMIHSSQGVSSQLLADCIRLKNTCGSPADHLCMPRGKKKSKSGRKW